MSKTFPLVFAFLIIFTGTIFAQNNTAQFLFNSDKYTFNAGEIANIDVEIDSKNTPVNAIDIKITYPVQSFELIDFNASISDFEISADEKAEKGQITIVRGTTSPKKGVNKIATLQLKALTDVSLDTLSYTPESVVMSSDNENILSGSQVIANQEFSERSPNVDEPNSFWEKIKAWNISFWEGLFSLITNLFNK